MSVVWAGEKMVVGGVYTKSSYTLLWGFKMHFTCTSHVAAHIRWYTELEAFGMTFRVVLPGELARGDYHHFSRFSNHAAPSNPPFNIIENGAQQHSMRWTLQKSSTWPSTPSNPPERTLYSLSLSLGLLPRLLLFSGYPKTPGYSVSKQTKPKTKKIPILLHLTNHQSPITNHQPSLHIHPLTPSSTTTLPALTPCPTAKSHPFRCA